MDELLDTAPCGFLSFADDGTVLLVNRTLLELIKAEREAVVGRSVERLLSLASRIFYQTHLFPLLTLQGRADEIFLLLKAPGGDVGALVNAVRRERDGQMVSDCVLMPVYERRKFEDALLLARRTAEEAQARLEVKNHELEAANEQLAQQAVELEVQQETLQAQAVELELHQQALGDANATLRRQAQELIRERAAAEDANRAKSSFLAVMSHELRTPLNAIGGYVQLMELGIHGPVTEAQQEALERIGRSQRHLMRLINDVLNLSRIEAGRVDYRLEDLTLASVLDQVLPMIEPQLDAKQLRLERRVPVDLAVRADRDKTQQILLNLLTNAMKFTEPGGRVTVDAVAHVVGPGTAMLRVTDTGIGIPREKLDSVFEPFVQVDTSNTRQTEGTGLGLAISRDLARGMGGNLTATSEVGRGSVFTLTLPLAGRD